MKEIGEVSWKLPPREMSWQYFRENFPSENNHVYSNLKLVKYFLKTYWKIIILKL